MNNSDNDDIRERVAVETPWFKLFVDSVSWREILVVAMVLVTVVYLIKG